MKKYLLFLWDCFRLSFVGDWRYHLWMTVLTIIALVGFHSYCYQFVNGLLFTLAGILAAQNRAHATTQRPA